MSSKMRLVATAVGLLALAGVCFANLSNANTSAWATRVGQVTADEETIWCTPKIEPDPANGRDRVVSTLQRISSDGDDIQYDYTHNTAAQRARVQCFYNTARWGSSTVLESGAFPSNLLTTDPDAVQTPTCPWYRPFGGHERCQMKSHYDAAFVYEGSDCGDGITSISTAEYLGQVTGGSHNHCVFDPFWPFVDTGDFYNNTNDGSPGGAVTGTDMGAIFFANGAINYAFGDSLDPSGSLDEDIFRHSVLYHSHDIDPSDGLQLDGYEYDTGTSWWAKETIPVYDSEFPDESPIPGAGVAVTDANDVQHRFLWFTSIHVWNDWGHTTYHSSLAHSIDGDDWLRAERQYPDTAPKWSENSHFYTGAIWYDRVEGEIYFFGNRSPKDLFEFMTGFPVRVAKVEAKPSAILDKTQYHYWNGFSWVQDTDGDLTESEPFGDDSFGPQADLIPASAHFRRDFSVIFNSYANRFMMLAPDYLEGEIELWQAEEVTGPWTQVAGGSRLPQAGDAPGALYSPFMGEALMVDGGREVYFIVSQFAPVLYYPGCEAYNIGLWKFTVNRDTTSWCNPAGS